MKLLITLLLMSLLSASTCKKLSSSENVSTQTAFIPTEPINQLHLSGAYSLMVQTSDKSGYSISADQVVLPGIKAHFSAGKLSIQTAEGFTVHSNQEIKVTIFTPSLEELVLWGATNGTLSGIKAQKFNATVNGSHRIKLSGKTETFDLKAAGSSGIKANDLEAEHVNALVGGACTVDVSAAQTLQVNLSGVSRLYYKGNPVLIKKEISGVSKLRKL